MTAAPDKEVLRFIAELHGPVPTSMVAIRIDGGALDDVEADSFEDIVSRDVVCMACHGYPTHPCATYLAAAEVLNKDLGTS